METEMKTKQMIPALFSIMKKLKYTIQVSPYQNYEMESNSHFH